MFWRRRKEHELERELQSHLDLEAEEQGGDSHSARRALGNKTLIQEDTRAAWGWSLLDRLWRDLSQGARMMRRRPVFTAVAVLSLAIGIGANTAIFSFLNAILIRTLPAPGANRLVVLRQTNTAFHIENCCFRYSLLEQLRGEDVGLEDLAATHLQQIVLKEDGRANLAVLADFVGGNYFSFFGGRPAIGRLLTESDNQAEGTGAVAVISSRLWQDRYGNDPSVLGRWVRVRNDELQIVGVTADDFPGSSLYQPPDIQIPASMVKKLIGINRDSEGWVEIFGRLKPGVTMDQAQQRLDTIGKQLERASGMKISDKDNFKLVDGSQGVRSRKDQFGRPVQVLMLLVSVLLLVACANLAGLLLVRSIERTKEAGMRVALGASKSALFRQFFSESILLAAGGGLAGLGLAWVFIRALSSYLETDNPVLVGQVRLNPQVLAYSAAVTAMAAILFGVLPALRAAHADPLPALQGQSSDRRRRPGTSRIILTVQVALSLALLFCAGLFTRTLANLRGIDIGFRAENLVILHPRLEGTKYTGPNWTPFFREMLQRARALPGISSASLAQIEPLSGSMTGFALTIPGYESQKPGMATAMVHAVSRGYFETLGVSFLAGEDFPEQSADGPVIVNQEFGRRYFAGNALGRTFSYGSGTQVRVTGVVGPTKYRVLREEPEPIVYLPLSKIFEPSYLQVRAAASAEQTIEQLRAMMHELDPNIAIKSVNTFETQIDEVLSRERLLAFLSTLLGGIAVALSAIGLYGVLAFSVVRRTREVGIRVAIGATRGEIVGLFLKEGAWPLIGGVIVGVPLALACGRLAETLLYGLKPVDVATAVSATGLLLMVALGAAMVPAWRASRLNPTAALRHD